MESELERNCEVLLKLATLKKLRNSMVGNLKQKKNLLNDGFLVKITDIWNKFEFDSKILCELAIMIGSIAQGIPESVNQLSENGGIILLMKGLCHSNGDLVFSSLKSLRHVYSSNYAPSDLIFKNTIIVEQLVTFLQYSPPFNENAAIIIANACQTQEHQRALLDNDIITALQYMSLSNSYKIIVAALQCLCAVIKSNYLAASSINESFMMLLFNLLSYSPSINVKLNSAICLTEICELNVINSSDSLVSLKLIPSLVLLCKPDIKDSKVRAMAATTLADLVCNNPELQEIAANTDDLLQSLVSFFYNKPDESDEFVDDYHIMLYDNLCQCSLNLLSHLCSTIEDIRFRVVSQPKIMCYLTNCLQSNITNTKIAATRCLVGLSRSTKLLRTYLSDVEIHISKYILEMLSSTNEDLVVIAASLLCNLLLSFCPCREVLVGEGIISTLCCLTIHSNSAIQLNAIWSLMNCARNADQDLLREIRVGLPVHQILMIMQQSQKNDQLLIKCLGLLVNLTQNTKETDSLMAEQGTNIAECIATLLAHGPSDDVCEQTLCLLINVSSSNSKNRDLIAENTLIMECLAQIMRTTSNHVILTAACTLVQNLADTSHARHIHRQNCLAEVGIQHALQKLELTESSALQIMSRNILDFFQTANL